MENLSFLKVLQPRNGYFNEDEYLKAPSKLIGVQNVAEL